MAERVKPLSYPLPVLEIQSITPKTEKNGKIYASLIRGMDSKNSEYVFRERKGIVTESFVKKPFECVLEITKATFYELDAKNIPENAIKGTFEGSLTGYKFFQELVSIIDGTTGDSDEDDYDGDEYYELANKLFVEWGVNGFGLEAHQDKPILKTDECAYFLNEYIFEELIEQWQQSTTPIKNVRFVVDEFLLLGIKPYEGDWKVKPKLNKYGFEEKPGEFYIVGKPKFIDNWEDDSISKRVKDGFKKIFGD